MSKVIIAIKDLSCTYLNHSEPALKGINLEIERGSCTLIAGMSGCGKSTLARCMNGLIPQIFKGKLQGQVLVDGMDASITPVWRLAQSVGMVFQNPESQLFTLMVEDEVAFGPENFGIPSVEIRRRVKWALNAVGLRELEARHVFELSDGQKQRLAVAANLSSQPEILIFDESTSNLDPVARNDFIRTISDLKSRWDKTIVLIDHRLHGLEECIDRVVVMEKGEIRLVSPPAILSDIETIRKFGLREFGLTESASTYTPSCFSPRIPDDAHGNSRDKHQDRIVINNASFSYGDNFHLQNVSLTIHNGEVVGIVGRNGAGKTTLLRLMVGLLKPDSGSILIEGMDARNRKPDELFDTLALVLQNPDHQLFMSMVSEEIALSLKTAGMSSSGEDTVRKILQETGIYDLRERHPHSLSQGEKQRVTIAAALARQPRVLILDEPTSGMDGYHLNLLKAWIRSLKKSDVSVVLASHDAELILDLCDRVVILEDGGLKNPVQKDELFQFMGVI